MKAIQSAILTLVCLVSISTLAANLPADFDAAGWKNLVDKVVNQGNILQTQAGEIRFLESVVPADTSKPHQGEYLTARGAKDQDGQYQVSSVTAISESWTIDADGNWNIAQQMLIASPSGELVSVVRELLVETQDRQVVSTDQTPGPAVDDPATLSSWGDKIKLWSAE